ncbi:DUF4153 domain-containing protein [Candidatus Palauibacter sp.]|uniref:DUF4153 domain-containing protein n=1 Tax=Candidatus Palauibacter sp. TaxID=3101350 RepID=UPI003B52FACB
MKLPSVERLAAAAWATARRFPVVLACAAIAAIAAMRAINAESAAELRLVATAALGLPLLTGLTLFAERWKLAWPRHWALRGLGLAVLALYYWQWPNWGENIAGLRHFHLTATLHLLVAFIVYLGVREPNGFWHFNRTLFFRFGLGAIYTGVLFGGLSIAMFGIDNLFNIDIADENYGRLFFFLGFVFQTWFVLAGVPDDFQRLERRDDYPAGLRVFAQYVLLPLVAVYLTILTAYLGRVVITTTWPSGWIGLLVSALAAFGILSLLLVHPRRGQEGHAWIDTYARLFWILIIPSIVMLLLAIGQRIGQYGITERRYLLLLLGVWLAGAAIFYTVTRSREIKWIPLTLAIIGAITFVGPWSAYAVAERSQVGRLEDLLSTHGVLTDGRVSPAALEIPNEDWQQVNDVLLYLISWHGTSGIDEWFEGGVTTVDTIGDGTEASVRVSEAGRRATLIAEHFGLVPSGGLVADPAGFVEISAPGGRYAVVPVSGFDEAVPDVDLLGGQYTVHGDSLTFEATADSLGTTIRLGGSELATVRFEALVARARRAGTATSPGRVQLPSDSLRLDASGGGVTASVQVTQLRMRDPEGELRTVRAFGTLLLIRAEDSPLQQPGG